MERYCCTSTLCRVVCAAMTGWRQNNRQDAYTLLATVLIMNRLPWQHIRQLSLERRHANIADTSRPCRASWQPAFNACGLRCASSNQDGVTNNFECTISPVFSSDRSSAAHAPDRPWRKPWSQQPPQFTRFNCPLATSSPHITTPF